MNLFSLFCILVPCLASGEILRLSNVVAEGGNGITKYEYGTEEEKRNILVEDRAIVTEADVNFAIPSQSRNDAVDIALTNGGTEKMIAATANLRPGVDRIAIIVNEKVTSAPVLQSVPLGKNFIISGLTEPDEPKTLAALISEKTLEEIQRSIAERDEHLKNLPPMPEPEYHTDEEYAALKKEREKIGLNYMDRMYTEEEIDKLLSPGMARAEVEAIFGKPNRISNTEDGTTKLSFQTAPEKLPIKKAQRMMSFIVEFKEIKLTSWGPEMWGDATREPKPLNNVPQPTNLVIKTPPADMSSEDFDFVTFYEGHKISLKLGKQEPTDADVYSILNILWSLGANSDDARTIDSHCDVVSIVAPKIPEIEAMRKESARGEISLSTLRKAIEPYVFGERPLP